MTLPRFPLYVLVLFVSLLATPVAFGQRQMENLGRGVVAVRASESAIQVSWRLLGFDPGSIGFNLYRSTNAGPIQKLNAEPLLGGTNYTDTAADLTQPNAYFVRPVIEDVELAASEAFTLAANAPIEPVVRIPLRAGGPIKFVWVGDLDGDGEYDYVIDRQTAPQKIEAYRRNGELLWEVDMGPNSLNQNNIEGGSTTIDVGHNDGVTVYDFDGDGRAEVAVRIANGVRFGDGQTFVNADDNIQFIAIIDGLTGALRATAPIPTDYLSDGPMYARFGVGYLNGVTPSLVSYKKNRIGSGDFNLMICAWDFDGSAVTMQWKWLRGNQDCPDGHNTRIIDVDGDGRDEIVEIGFVLNGDGTLRYTLGSAGIVHGDRFHIAKIDPDRPGLQGFGVQQNNPSGLLEYYYDAADGAIIWKHFGAVSDVGRGMVGDIDPNFRGMEVWSFHGLYNGPSNQLTLPNNGLRPWPQHGLWWDGDLTMELLNDGKFEKWNPASPTPTNAAPRLLRISTYGAIGYGVYPLFNGDIMGDWREEVVYTNPAYDQLVIFTTDQPSPHRLYTLAHNPAYRNSLTLKGYMQSHHVDYFLGHDMDVPPPPNIVPVFPATSAVPAIAGFSVDTGVASNDRITNDNTPTLTGVGPANATIIVSRLGLADDGTTVSDGTGAWTFAYAAPLPDGAHYFLARLDDGQNNYSFPFAIEIDTTPSAAPAISSVASDGSGGFIVQGTGPAGLRIAVSIDGIGSIGTVTAGGDGAWTLAYAGPGLPGAVNSFRAEALDIAGNASAAATRVVNLAVATPAIVGISDDTGTSASDAITSDGTLILHGTAGAGAEVTVFRADAGMLGTATADENGIWSFDYRGTSLAPGTYSFTAYVGDSAGSPAFPVVVDTTAPVVSSIDRFAPGDASINGTQVTFRISFSEPVSGVDSGDFDLTWDGGLTGTLTSVTPAGGTAYDVVVDSLSGQGTIRLDLKASGTGITDLAGNAIETGFTTGQVYTRVLVGDGVWTRTDSGGLWSQNANWLDGIIAEGAGVVADFSTLDLNAHQTVHLDSSRVVSYLSFGDTDPASAAGWTIDGDGDSSNGITLVPGASAPAVTVQPLGAGATVALNVPISGNTGFTKAGAGTLVLDAANPVTGTISINAGTLRLGSNAVLSPNAMNVSNGGTVFALAGGNLDVNGTTSVNGGSLLQIDSGSATFGNIAANNSTGNTVRINGGSVTANAVSFQRSTTTGMAYNTGFIVAGGNAVIGSLALGTANSNALSSIEGGSLVVSGAITLGNQSSGGRGGHIRVTGGTLASTDSSENGGLIVTRRNANVATANFLGGVSTVERITLGYDATVTSGSGTLTVAGGSLYLGAGGIRSRATGAFVTTVNFESGLVGAKASWSSVLDANLPAGGAVVLKAANAAGDAFDIALSGVLSGAGGFTKTGAGVLTLSGTNTFTGPVAVDAGTLAIAGGVAPGASLTVNAGGTLAGTGGVNRAVVINSGGQLSPAGDSAGPLTTASVTWNPGGKLRVDLGSAQDTLAIAGSLTKGDMGAGAYEIAVVPGAGFANGSYTLVTLGSTDFTGADFTVTGLGVTPAAVQVRGSALVLVVGAASTPYEDWAAASGLPLDQRGMTDDPDGDGLANLLEFALGLDPASANASDSTLTVVDDSGERYPAITFTRRQNLGNVVVSVQVSTNLDFNSPIAATEVSATDNGDGTDTVVVRSTVPLSEEPRQFLRLNAVDAALTF